ncbi:DUF3422 domain-containing protein [Sphingomonas sp.]|jgi:uncharacterized membrane-anchored protein|uniref:DUF3422 family protein n=1 Tax=Sphingomonas sp. TaxID=28214 RepID=UPI002D7F678E|nr:DUF3422 domain-containing protein [Sphingomonas sp.]HEU0045642.1 DUF3422 domain-containing protein [Sphingomonas sp.]
MIADHPLRASIADEMHVRRLPRFAAPCRLMQVVTVLGEKAGDAPRRHLEALAATTGSTAPISDRYAVLQLAGMSLVWERHTEFASYTLLRDGSFDMPFDPAHFEPQLSAILADMPGEILRATQIALLPSDAPEPTDAQRDAWFSSEATVVCDVADGAARIMSDFRLQADGYGRLLVLDRHLAGDEPAQLVQRLQELGNYRNKALLGLPLAQRLTPAVTGLEARLAELTGAVSERRSQDDQLLDELTYLSAELARLVAETRYRMSATRAYAQLSIDRLASLRIGPVRGHQTLADFTERRLTPAVRTCESFSARLENLSQRAAWTSELLRTRIDIALAKQNRDLLTSMDRRTQLQLRLQQTVEGLSVVAISYYLVGLAKYVFEALPGVDYDRATAVAVPVVLTGVALALWNLRRRLHD